MYGLTQSVYGLDVSTLVVQVEADYANGRPLKWAGINVNQQYKVGEAPSVSLPKQERYFLSSVEQQVFHKALLASVEIIHEGELI